MKQLLRTKAAGAYIGVSSQTMRKYANNGRVPYVTVGGQMRFDTTDLDFFLIGSKPRVEAHYVRVSGSTGQETSIGAQKQMLSDAALGEVYKTYVDKGSGLNTKRPRLQQMLRDAATGKFNVVVVTHQDRLTRFGFDYLQDLLHCYGVSVEVLDTTTKNDTEELLDDFMSLVASFSGRMYGMRSREHKKALLDKASINV